MEPYRTSPRVVDPWPYARSRWGRLTCLLAKHDWHVLRTAPLRMMALCTFSGGAGLDAQCRRCGEVWEDASNGCPELLATGFRCLRIPDHCGDCGE